MEQELTLSSIEQAIGELMKGPSEGLVFVFNDELKSLEIEIDGPLFHGGITGEVARGLAELQEELYRAARLAVTGKEGRDSRLTKDQKEQLELVIDVRKGCSVINIDIGKFGEGLTKILGDQLNGMTSGEIQFLVLGAVALLAMAWLGKRTLDDHFKAKVAKQGGEETTKQLQTVVDGQIKVVQEMSEIISHDRRLERFADATAVGLTQVAVRATDATSVKMGPVEFDQDELAALRRRAPKSSSETLHETGNFRVLRAERNGSQFRLTLGGAVIPGEFMVEYDRTEFSSHEDQLIWDALRDQTEVPLEVKAEQLRGKIKGAVIVSIDPL